MDVHRGYIAKGPNSKNIYSRVIFHSAMQGKYKTEKDNAAYGLVYSLMMIVGGLLLLVVKIENRDLPVGPLIVSLVFIILGLFTLRLSVNILRKKKE